jgi:hypothetical protein
MPLRLLETKAFPSGVVLLEYQRGGRGDGKQMELERTKVFESPADTLCYKHSFSLPDASKIWYVLREKASNSVSERKVLPNEDSSSL